MLSWTIDEVAAQLRALGVERGDVLLVHTAFRALKPIAGGPLGFTRALRDVLGDEGTLVMPTMTDGESLFDRRATPTLHMGIVAELFWRQPGVVRSTHPGGSFAAQGKHAELICREQPLSPPHGVDSPVGRVHDLDGKVLIAGATHGENTTLHLAEDLARVPYSVSHPCVTGMLDGALVTTEIAETDHCCRNFTRLDAWLDARGLQREGPLGNGTAKLARSKDIVAVALEHLRANPLVFLCAPDARCTECDAARASIRS